MAERINSRKKGSRNERDVAKLMATWSGFEFARTPQSGGLHWKKQNTTGDIVCIDEKHGHKFPFSIECKNHEDVEFSYLLDGTKGKRTNKIRLFWEQTTNDATRVNKIPMLFIHRKGMPKNSHFICLPTIFIKPFIKDRPDIGFDFGVMTYVNRDYGLKISFINSIDLVRLDYMELFKYARKFLKNG